MSCGPENYMELCRLCASYDVIKLEIFGEEGRERNLVDKIQTCLPFKVSETDKLPKSLCYRCMYNLENFYDFRKKSVNAVALLETCIGLPQGSTEVGSELKEQIRQLHTRFHQVKKEDGHEDIPMPHLEPQFPVPSSSSQKKHVPNAQLHQMEMVNVGSKTSVSYSPPSQNEIINLDPDTDSFVQDNSVDIEIIGDTRSQHSSGRKRSIAQSGRFVDEASLSQETLHKCSKCNKTFSSKGNLALHEKLHINETDDSRSKLDTKNVPLDRKSDPNWKSGYYRPYRCDLCRKSFSTTKHRWGHVSVCHRGDPLVTCLMCSQTFSTCLELEEHKKTKHSIEEGEVVDITEDDNGDVPEILKPTFPNKTIGSFPSGSRKLSDGFNSIQTIPRDTSVNESGILHTCTQCLKVFKTEDDLEKHSHFHKRRISSDSTSRSSQSEIEKKVEYSKSHEVGKRLESIRSSEHVRKMTVPGSNSGTSLLKQTLLQNRASSEGRLRKKSPASDASAEEVRMKKRGLSTEIKSNGGNRRKSSQPRKIARNSDEVTDDDLVEDGKVLDTYSCSICKQDFPSMSELQKHSSFHDAETDAIVNNAKPFTCLLCEKSFSLRNSLSRHFNACHGIDPSEVMDISRYQRTSPKKQDITATNTTANNQALSRKIDGYGQKLANQITLEEDIIQVEDSVREADMTSDQQSLFMCEVCLREFGDRASLWLHLRYTHKEYAAYACGICLRICENNTLLYKHWKTAHPTDSTMTDQRRYSCQMCGRQHDSRKKLLAHVAIHDLNNGSGGIYDPETIVTVNAGFYKFENTHDSSLEQDHSGKYTSEDYIKGTSFGCELCYKSFPTEDGLVKHKKCAHRLKFASEMDASSSNRSSYQLYFVCELCGSSHRSKSERWRHVFRAHNGESALTCEKQGCGKVFPTRTLKQEHSNNHHRLQGATPNVCEICGKLWGTRVVFWKHLMGVHPDCVPLTCGVCLKIFCTVPELQAHVQSNHLPLTGGDFCCDICGRPYSNRSKLSRHRKIHMTDDLGASDLAVAPAGKLHSSSADIPENNYHSLYSDPTDMSSEGIGKKVSSDTKTETKYLHSSLAKLSKVLGSSSGTKATKIQSVPFCDACPELTFQSISELADHRRKIHSLHPCDLCSKFYGRTSHLWKHVKRIHNNHPELTCPLCKRISASKAHLENHIATKHCPKKPTPSPKIPLSMLSFSAEKMANIPILYPCQKCSRRFRKRYLLNKHQRHCLRRSKPKSLKLSNAGSFIKDRTCDICSRMFPTPSRLKEHQRTFHAPQHCELCADVSFLSKPDLFTHIRETHIGHPNFTCPVPQCSRTMRSKSDRSGHHKQHESDKFPPTCDLCGEVCLTKSRLWNHLGSVQHKDKIPLICGACFKYLPTTEELNQHIQSEHQEDLEAPDTCRLCARSYSSVYKVMDHFTKSHPEYYACRECLTVFKTKAELQDHNINDQCKPLKQDGGTANTDTADNSIERRENVDSEVVEDNSNDITESAEAEMIKYKHLSCKICSVTFSTSEELEEHDAVKHQNKMEHNTEEQLSHDSDDTDCNRAVKRPRRTYNCEKCSLFFSSPSELADHKSRKHAPLISDLKPYHCACCDKHFSNKTSYWKHINSAAHRAKRMQRNSFRPVVEGIHGDVTRARENVHNASIKTSPQNQGEGDSNVPYVFIPDSNVEGDLVNEIKSENNCNTSYQNSESNEDISIQESVADEMCLLTESESMDYDSEHALSYDITESSNKAKESYKKLEVLKAASDRPHTKPLYCQVCGKEWPALKHLWQHLIRNHRREAAITCGLCLKVCADYHELSSHLNILHPNNFRGEGRNFTCRICGRYHAARSKLIQHAAIHIVLGSEPKYQPQSHLHNCQKCFKSFTSEKNLFDHQLFHKSSFTITNSVGLNDKKVEHQCEVCNKICGNVGALMSHRRTHKIKPEDFSHKDDLLELVAGESEKMEDQQTVSSSNNTQMIYTCEICSTVFRNESEFSEHKRSHGESSGIKNIAIPPGIKFLVPKIEKQKFYICDICALVFMTEESLATHAETHNLSPSNTGDLSDTDTSEDASEVKEKAVPEEDAFACSICCVTFDSSFILNTHLEVYHNKHYPCTICKMRTFTSYINLVKHRRFCRTKYVKPYNFEASRLQLKKWHENPTHKSNYVPKINKVPLMNKEEFGKSANGSSKLNLIAADKSEELNTDTVFSYVEKTDCMESADKQEFKVSERKREKTEICEEESVIAPTCKSDFLEVTACEHESLMQNCSKIVGMMTPEYSESQSSRKDLRIKLPPSLQEIGEGTEINEGVSEQQRLSDQTETLETVVHPAINNSKECILDTMEDYLCCEEIGYKSESTSQRENNKNNVSLNDADIDITCRNESVEYSTNRDSSAGGDSIENLDSNCSGTSPFKLRLSYRSVSREGSVMAEVNNGTKSEFLNENEVKHITQNSSANSDILHDSSVSMITQENSQRKSGYVDSSFKTLNFLEEIGESTAINSEVSEQPETSRNLVASINNSVGYRPLNTLENNSCYLQDDYKLDSNSNGKNKKTSPCVSNADSIGSCENNSANYTEKLGGDSDHSFKVPTEGNITADINNTDTIYFDISQGKSLSQTSTANLDIMQDSSIVSMTQEDVSHMTKVSSSESDCVDSNIKTFNFLGEISDGNEVNSEVSEQLQFSEQTETRKNLVPDTNISIECRTMDIMENNSRFLEVDYKLDTNSNGINNKNSASISEENGTNCKNNSIEHSVNIDYSASCGSAEDFNSTKNSANTTRKVMENSSCSDLVTFKLPASCQPASGEGNILVDVKNTTESKLLEESINKHLNQNSGIQFELLQDLAKQKVGSASNSAETVVECDNNLCTSSQTMMKCEQKSAQLNSALADTENITSIPSFSNES